MAAAKTLDPAKPWLVLTPSQRFLAGLVLDVKAWGSDAPYRPVMPFRPSGGEGGER